MTIPQENSDSSPEKTSSNVSAFTGRRRKKKTSFAVKFGDFFSTRLITIGGIGTIFAVSLVGVLLIGVALPLFGEAEFGRIRSGDVEFQDGKMPVKFKVDEYQTMAWAMYEDGRLQIMDLASGNVIDELQLFEDKTPTAFDFIPEVDDEDVRQKNLTRITVAVGFDDGSAEIGTIGFRTAFARPSEVPADLRQLGIGEKAVMSEGVDEILTRLNIDADGVVPTGVVKVTSQRQHRLQLVEVDFNNPILSSSKLGKQDAITKIAFGQRGQGFGLAAYSADGKLAFANLRRRKNAIDQSVTYKIVSSKKDVAQIEYDFEKRGEPQFMLVPTRGDMIYCVWKDGHCARFDLNLVGTASLAEEMTLLNKGDGEVTACDFVLNRETLLVGDSQGNIRAWFPVKRNASKAEVRGLQNQVKADQLKAELAELTSAVEAKPLPENIDELKAQSRKIEKDLAALEVRLKGAIVSQDGKLLTPVHELGGNSESIQSFGISERTRLVTVGYANGTFEVFHVTTDQLIIGRKAFEGKPIDFIVIAPKDDGIIAVSGNKMWVAEFERGHPETTWQSLFDEVWYEGYEEPEAMWQSSFAGVGPEMKLGLWPLVFGTLKATVYCMLIGAPLALLAAIYTSEFSHPRAKATIKPVVEMMASLPSVVLGFMAALVFAPFVETWLPHVLAGFLMMGFVFVLTSFLWHLLPSVQALILQRYRFVYCLVLIPIGIFLSYLAGPILEEVSFAGNTTLWLDGQIGTGTGAWMILLLPISLTIVAFVWMTMVNSWMRRNSSGWSRGQFALINLVKFGLGTLAVFGLSWLISSALTSMGFDPRGSYIDTYVQRNALVVGFAMGFAVIPIIYTIAEDALSTVPMHLRSASLGAGATPWQTTIRIVVPTAMSGLFSALMIGLGRAVGETMIVLMAAGNTPVMEWNMFNGFRTLAANIAVELPEAVQYSTHYRVLFLAALLLFGMTFVVNTVAELVRLQFRKRAVQM